jgi:hypothetical protein
MFNPAVGAALLQFNDFGREASLSCYFLLVQPLNHFSEIARAQFVGETRYIADENLSALC